MALRPEADPYALEFVDAAEGHDAKVPEYDDYSRSAWHGNYTWTDQAGDDVVLCAMMVYGCLWHGCEFGCQEWLQRRFAKFGGETWSSRPLSIYEAERMELRLKQNETTFATNGLTTS